MALLRTHLAFRFAACLALAATSACGADAAQPATPPTPAPAHLRLDERANHTTVSVTVGTSVVITLHSTYWSDLTSKAPDVLAAAGTSQVTPAHTCAPGAGCGTVELTLRAVRPGSADITARRTSCGEARRCVGGEGRYSVTVKIRG
ncbi:hypothetical protein [Streptomyces gibsoniae]|uniref:Lipoprotein n=1 Tax=Streptomyces gibsoniae TaxID=3075529 RepID=A0ABU2U8R0_9ACTN|nr:hypothetical protein [Streptomyces sp. DSM 41699]MDT0469624.1 hypothetical protein [Streptomyces sp. DSM 41699]